MQKKYDTKILKKILNKNFTFSDVDEKLNNIEASTSNIFCPFHEHNYRTPSSKIYYNETEDIYVWKCFTGNCGTHTTYDYVKDILIDKYEKYKNIVDFLIQKLGKVEFETKYREYEELTEDYIETALEKKVEYIDNVYNETLNIFDYIERLWTA